MKLFNLLAKLLDYPDEELMKHLGEITEQVSKLPDISEQETASIQEFISWMDEHKTIAMQEIYVNTFDITPENDLHLTHHLFGDDNRDRGPALIDLSEHYKQAGLEVKQGELPDYLPLMLEYLSSLSDIEVKIFLGDVIKILKVLAENLEKAKSPYALLIRIVENRGYLAKAAEGE
jgi:nitrate reductase delta subunit